MQETGLEHTCARVFPFVVLKNITDNFSEERIIGRGGSGVVYKGVLHNGEVIAVKKLHHDRYDSSGKKLGNCEVQFHNEVMNLLGVQHPNVIRLLGYCYEVQNTVTEYDGKRVFASVEERVLCLEYMQGGSLKDHISDESYGFEWQTRYNIIKGVCEGLKYLHTGSKNPIYHLDLKPENIWLDRNMIPKIGDFGMSRLPAGSMQTYATENPVSGTIGYMAPEYIGWNQISQKCDVYSLGFIMICVIAGEKGPQNYDPHKPSEEFIERILKNWGKRLKATMSQDSLQQVKTCTEIALKCVEFDRDKRPTITYIVDELNKIDAAESSTIGGRQNAEEEEHTTLERQGLTVNQIQAIRENNTRYLQPRYAENPIRQSGFSRTPEWGHGAPVTNFWENVENQKSSNPVKIEASPTATSSASFQRQYAPAQEPVLPTQAAISKPADPSGFGLSLFGSSWSDPRIEFAFKILTGDIPVLDDSPPDIQGQKETNTEHLEGKKIEQVNDSMKTNLQTPITMDLPNAFGVNSAILSPRSLWTGSKEQDLHGDVLHLHSDLERLRETLPIMYNLIDVAEWKSHENFVAMLFPKLKDAVYDAEDLLDEFRWHDMKVKLDGNASKSPLIGFIDTVVQGGFNKLNDVQGRLDHLSNQLEKMGLRVVTQRFDKTVRPETSSLPNEAKIFGRDKELKQVMGYLSVPSKSKRKRARCLINAPTCTSSSNQVSNQSGITSLPVLPLVGIGGVGKTTLAQHICNNEQVKAHFEKVIWICVSDDFDVKRLTKEVMSCLGTKAAIDNLNSLQHALSNHVNNRRLLIVLDDMWDDAMKENGQCWETFCAPLKTAKEGSMMLVTTRCSKVAKGVQTMEPVILEGLNDDIFWNFFKLCAFGSESSNNDPELERIGRNILPKLKGSPLAAKTLGRMLRMDLQASHWNSILESELWELKQEVNDILPALRLSYMYLPFYLKRCFSFCAVYPKDYKFGKEELAEVWVAEGFVETQGADSIQKTGCQYFQDLLTRSFFQKVSGGGYVIHDLLHDMAQKVSEHDCFILRNKNDFEKVPLNVRHIYVHPSSDFDNSNLSSLSRHTKLRTLICKKQLGNKTSSVMNDWCTKLLRIRVMSCASTNELPDSIGNLKHLRYLQISKGSYLLDPQGGMSLSPRVSTQDAKESQEVKEVLRAQMEMQRSLHEQVEGKMEDSNSLWLPAEEMDFPTTAWTDAAMEGPVTASLGPMAPLLRQVHSLSAMAPEHPVTASLGPMAPVLRQVHSLSAMAPEHIQGGSEADVKRLKEQLEVLCKDLLEPEETSSTPKWWRKEVRELLYDTEDRLDEVTIFQAGDFSELIAGVEDACERRKRLQLDPNKTTQPDLSEAVLSYFTPQRTSVELSKPISVQGHLAGLGVVGIEDPMNKLVEQLAFDDDRQKRLKAIPIVGFPGVGKTTVAGILYYEHRGKFQCSAFVRVSRTPDTRSLLISILSQIKAPGLCGFPDVHDLIDGVRKHLKGKRYFIIMDDLWTASIWDIISRAFPDSDCGSRIITTTQIDDVALACCRYYPDYIEMSPLSDDQSKELFFTRVFGSENHCPPDFKKVSCKIINKCAGLPLAILSIASLLASESYLIVEKWEHIQDSLPCTRTNATSEGVKCLSSDTAIGSGGRMLARGPNIEKWKHRQDSLPFTSEGLKQVLNLVYNNLPNHLKACLLYLCMYPEGYLVRKHDLVRQWVAEGFVNAMGGRGAEETAGVYFDELVRRGMVQPAATNNGSEVLSCTVHHMVLDLIRHKSKELNFIITVDNLQSTLALPDEVRRLSVQFGGSKGADVPENILISKVRSLLFWGFFECVPSVVDYALLRVLILHIWADEEETSFDLTSISELLLLRYLKIQCNIMVNLPDEIKGLKCLETLEVDARLSAVPGDIGHLKKLLHLLLPSEAILPKGLDGLTSLLTLGCFDLSKNSTQNVIDLAGLTNLQDVHLTCSTEPSELPVASMEHLRSILEKLNDLRSLTLHGAGSSSQIISDDGLSIVSPSPAHLEKLELLPRICTLSRLPKWIGELSRLSILKIEVLDLSIDDIAILKDLASLSSLSLSVRTELAEWITFDNEGFPVLKYFKFVRTAPYMSFLEGAMPNVQKLKLAFDANRLMPEYSPGTFGFQHMARLTQISVKFGGAVADDSNKRDAERVWKDAFTNHPNNPILDARWVDCIFNGGKTTDVEDTKGHDRRASTSSDTIEAVGQIFKKARLH